MQQNEDDSRSAVLVWHKGAGVGPFKFGAELQTCAWALEGPPCSVSPALAETSYRVRGNHDAYVCFEDAKISLVGSCTEFIIGDTNIIGTTLAQVTFALGQEPDETEMQEVIDETQKVLYFYEFGLTLWMRGGVVASVQATAAF